MHDTGLVAVAASCYTSFDLLENQPKKKQTVKLSSCSSPFSHMLTHTLSRAALSRPCNSIAAPASVPDTQALLSNTTPRITCSRLPVSHTCTNTMTSIILPLPRPRFDQAHLRVLLGRQRIAILCRRKAENPDPGVRRRWRLLASRVLMKHGNNFLICS